MLFGRWEGARMWVRVIVMRSEAAEIVALTRCGPTPGAQVSPVPSGRVLVAGVVGRSLVVNRQAG